jgi:hypothetical protein
MGASSSLISQTVEINGKNVSIDGTLYKRLDCGCIFCAKYEKLQPYELELALPCYNCLQDLRCKQKNSFNINEVKKLYSDIKELEIDFLIGPKNGWLIESDAIEYAKENRISIIELVNSNYILKKYGITF